MLIFELGPFRPRLLRPLLSVSEFPNFPSFTTLYLKPPAGNPNPMRWHGEGSMHLRRFARLRGIGGCAV